MGQVGTQEAICRFTSGFTSAHCDYFRFLSIIIFAFPLDYRISCFRLRFIRFGLLDSCVFDLDFYMFDFEFEIFDFEFKIFDFEFKILDFDCKNRRLRLKYYCSYFCPQRNAIVIFDLHCQCHTFLADHSAVVQLNKKEPGRGWVTGAKLER